MSQTKSSSEEPAKSKDVPPQEKPPWFRETVESFGVALILAFLFRAFVAEAFVIPTGSMAPTLMGAHKDVRCPECGCDYQAGSSVEYDQLGFRTDNMTIGTTCPLCRFELPLDLVNNANHWTFSGDRILVSKFAYMFSTPKRWDVIVFKYPDDARINYIKRCIGLPNEKLQVYNGDIFVTKKGEEKPTIERKPASTVTTLLQPIYDSKHRSKSIVKAGVPDNWQPYPKSSTAWKTEQTELAWQAECDGTSTSEATYLRYFHRVFGPANVRSDSTVAGKPPERLSWDMVRDASAALIDPYFASPVFDFTAYNSSLVTQRSSIMDRNGKPSKAFRSGVNPREYDSDFPFWPYDQRSGINFLNDGMNWVGDLACEFEVNIENNSGTLLLDLVEAGVHHTCSIDIATGKATLEITSEGKPLDAFVNGTNRVASSTASTPIRSGTARIKYANVDDQLLLWVNGRLQEFDSGTFFDLGVGPGVARSPVWTQADPLDAAPVGLGSKGVKMSVTSSRVWRDVYYLASVSSDYKNKFGNPQEALLDPKRWAENRVIANRRTGTFELRDKEYFPMGDNSPASSDARDWGSLPEDLLIGRAILVFWPHHWNRPIPYLPNIKRFRLIR